MLGTLLGNSTGLLWHAIPIVLAISFVYGATRHELMKPILYHAYRTAIWIVGFMGIVVGVLAVVSWFV